MSLDEALFTRAQEKGLKFPTLLDVMSNTKSFKLSVEDDSRSDLTITNSKYHMGDWVIPTLTPNIYLLVDSQIQIIGLLETNIIQKLDLEINLDILMGMSVTLKLGRNLHFINSITLKGSQALAPVVKIQDLTGCTNLYKILLEDTIGYFMEDSCNGLFNLWYIKGQVFLSGARAFKKCIKLKSTGTIVSSGFPKEVYLDCVTLEEVKHQPLEFMPDSSEPIVGTDAFGNCKNFNPNSLQGIVYIMPQNNSCVIGTVPQETEVSISELLMQVPNIVSRESQEVLAHTNIPEIDTTSIENMVILNLLNTANKSLMI